MTLPAAVRSVIFSILISPVFTISMSSNVKAADLLLHRHRREAPDEAANIGCVHMTASEGDYYHVSEGSHEVCGLYVIGDVNTLVKLEITEFDISCKGGGVMALVDGWELSGQLFPSPQDMEGGEGEQYRTYCGANPPPPSFVSSQNVALVQFRVPSAGHGFRVRVRFLTNPRPCNVLAPFASTSFTMENFGNRGNCTTHILFPVDLLLLRANVRTTSVDQRRRREMPGLSVHCDGMAGADMVSFMYGTGLDTSSLHTRMAFCGRREMPARRAVTLGCEQSAVRLQSSGLYYNSLAFEISTPGEEQLASFLQGHPACALLK